MRVLKIVIGVAVCLLIGAGITLGVLTSCGYSIPGCSQDRPDSLYVANAIEEAVNPSFSTVQDILSYQQEVIYDYSTDEIFRNMPEDVLSNVASICVKKFGQFEKADIVRTYMASKDIFDNLPSSPIANDASSPDTTTQETANVSYRYEIDTVDGKPVYTRVKEERTHEK